MLIEYPCNDILEFITDRDPSPSENTGPQKMKIENFSGRISKFHLKCTGRFRKCS